MNRTIVGRITTLRGVRHQIETFVRQATELGPWAPIAVPFLLYVFVKSYQGEQRTMLEERTRALKQEKQQYDLVERQLVREISAKAASPRGVRRLLPRRVRRAS
jgi:hypothetical protein